jgi:hypothetical protein
VLWLVPVGELAVALLVLPAPLSSAKELDLLELLLPPEPALGAVIARLLVVGADAKDGEKVSLLVSPVPPANKLDSLGLLLLTGMAGGANASD